MNNSPTPESNLFKEVNTEDTYRILQLYHTSMRNVGLYTSISFAALGYSRYHRGKTFFLNILLIFISMVFTIIALIICHFLIKDLSYFSEKDDISEDLILKWNMLPHIMLYTNIVLLLASLYVFYVQFN